MEPHNQLPKPLCHSEVNLVLSSEAEERLQDLAAATFSPTQPPGAPDAAWKLEEGCCAAGISMIHQVIECDLEPQHRIVIMLNNAEDGFEV